VIEWECQVLDSPMLSDFKQVNAACLPGGKVVVFRGLLDLFRYDETALAVVLSHEAGNDIFINLFISILLEGFEEGAENEQEDEPKQTLSRPRYRKARRGAARLCQHTPVVCSPCVPKSTKSHVQELYFFTGLSNRARDCRAESPPFPFATSGPRWH